MQKFYCENYRTLLEMEGNILRCQTSHVHGSEDLIFLQRQYSQTGPQIHCSPREKYNLPILQFDKPILGFVGSARDSKGHSDFEKEKPTWRTSTSDCKMSTLCSTNPRSANVRPHYDSPESNNYLSQTKVIDLNGVFCV